MCMCRQIVQLVGIRYPACPASGQRLNLVNIPVITWIFQVARGHQPARYLRAGLAAHLDAPMRWHVVELTFMLGEPSIQFLSAAGPEQPSAHASDAA